MSTYGWILEEDGANSFLRPAEPHEYTWAIENFSDARQQLKRLLADLRDKYADAYMDARDLKEKDQTYQLRTR